jgi:mRNA-degrading endonuclease YafQ of YafQ-DinJ toxin-antitoxin module
LKTARKKSQHKTRKTYTLLDEMMASPTEPMPAEYRRHQLTRMYGGLEAMAHGDLPTPDDWSVVSDAVNMLETMVLEMAICEDRSGTLKEAVRALGEAGQRQKQQGKQIRLDGRGMEAVREVLASYSDLLNALPARVMYRCHRLTERRLYAILAGCKKPHDVIVSHKTKGMI